MQAHPAPPPPFGVRPPHVVTSDGSMAPPPPPPPQFSQPMEGIADPHHNDVLCGRGVTTNRHKGNENFRGFVNRNKALYVSSTKRQKMTISRSIVEAVRNLDPPGRFLEKDLNTGLWFDVGDKKAVEKTSQALRDGAANLRKQLSEDLTDPTFIGAVFGEGGKGEAGKDKGQSKQAKKKPKNHSRSFSDSLCTPSLTHEPSRKGKNKLAESHPAIPTHQMSFPPPAPNQNQHAHAGQYDSNHMHIDHPNPAMPPTGAAAGMQSSFTIGERGNYSGAYSPNQQQQSHHNPHSHHGHGHGHYPHNQHQHQGRPPVPSQPYYSEHNQHSHVVSPCSSAAGANSPPYSPPTSPPYSPTPNSPPLHHHHQQQQAHHPPYATPHSHGYPPQSPAYHTPQSQHSQYWSPQSQSHNGHNGHNGSANSPYHAPAVTPDGRPPAPYHSHYNSQQQQQQHARWRPQEAPHEYVEVTHDGHYQFSEHNNRHSRSDHQHHHSRPPPPPVSPNDNDAKSTRYYSAYSEQHEHDEAMRYEEMRDRTPSPTPRTERTTLFDDSSMSDDTPPNDEHNPNAGEDAKRTSPHTAFTPPRNKGRTRHHNHQRYPDTPQSLQDSPISLGSGKLDDIWLKETPLNFDDDKCDKSCDDTQGGGGHNSEGSSIRSGDSYLAPLPFRDHSKSNISPFMNILCGCAPNYCPSDVSSRKHHKRSSKK